MYVHKCQKRPICKKSELEKRHLPFTILECTIDQKFNTNLCKGKERT